VTSDEKNKLWQNDENGALFCNHTTRTPTSASHNIRKWFQAKKFGDAKLTWRAAPTTPRSSLLASPTVTNIKMRYKLDQERLTGAAEPPESQGDSAQISSSTSNHPISGRILEELTNGKGHFSLSRIFIPHFSQLLIRIT
jgi:hypothetical protein